MVEVSVIRENLMNREGYAPYCGSWHDCSSPRTEFNGEQFKCPECTWMSTFPKKFIRRYKEKWEL